MGNKWTHVEDTVLRNEVESFGEDETVSWTQIARKLPGRSNKDCRKRWQKIHGQWHRGAWSETEDTKLRQAVDIHGSRWKAISDAVGTRTPDQCHKRWRNTLNPKLDRSKWTQNDDDCLSAAVTLHGRNWSLISRECFPTRSPLELSNKNGYASHSQSQRPHPRMEIMLQPLDKCHSNYTQHLLSPQLRHSVSSNLDIESNDVSTVGFTPISTQASCRASPTTTSSSPYVDMEYFDNAAWKPSRESMSEAVQSAGSNTTSFPFGFIPDPMLQGHPVTDSPEPVTTSFAFDSTSTLNNIQHLVETDFETPHFFLGSFRQPDAQGTVPGVLLAENTILETENFASLLQNELNNWHSVQEQTDRRPEVARGSQRQVHKQASGSAEQCPGLSTSQRASNTLPSENVTLVLENVDPETREKVLQLMYQKKDSSLLRVSLD